MLRAKPVGELQGSGGADPLGVPRGGGNASVQRLSVFDRDKRQPCFHKMKENFIELAAFGLQHATGDFDSRVFQAGNAPAGNQRIGVGSGDHDAPDVVPDDEVGAGGSLAGMAAGLQRHVKRRAGNLSLRVLNGVDFRVILTAALMVSTADDPAVFDNHGAHHRIGAGIAPSFRGQFQGQMHVLFVGHGNFITSTKQSMQSNSDVQSRQHRGSFVLIIFHS